MTCIDEPGYDPNTMFSAAYDWRLSYINLEERGSSPENSRANVFADRYFTKLKVSLQ
jgi:phospholipid:diacylglycerol acyltransferase